MEKVGSLISPRGGNQTGKEIGIESQGQAKLYDTMLIENIYHNIRRGRRREETST
jgi:hypothetical protein